MAGFIIIIITLPNAGFKEDNRGLSAAQQYELSHGD
jgi:hypothetical protein